MALSINELLKFNFISVEWNRKRGQGCFISLECSCGSICCGWVLLVRPLWFLQHLTLPWVPRLLQLPHFKAAASGVSECWVEMLCCWLETVCHHLLLLGTAPGAGDGARAGAALVPWLEWPHPTGATGCSLAGIPENCSKSGCRCSEQWIHRVVVQELTFAQGLHHTVKPGLTSGLSGFLPRSLGMFVGKVRKECGCNWSL